jgi:hypothetical protein
MNDTATYSIWVSIFIYTVKYQGSSDSFDADQAEQDSESDSLSFKELAWLCLTN